jgi:hypothetical protein
MSWLFSRALVEEYSGARSSGGEPSAPSRSMPTAQAYLSHGKTTAFSRLSRFGMTCEPLTEGRGEALLTWFRAGFPARTFPAPGEGTDSTGSGADCGANSPGSLARYDLATHSLRTAQLSLFEAGCESLRILPRWGFLRGGELFPLPMPELRTEGNGSGLWPTVRSSDGERGGRGDLIQAVRGNENGHFKMWPTPTASDQNIASQSPEIRIRPNGICLADAARMWPTPTARDWRSESCSPEFMEERNAQTRGKTLPWEVRMWPTPTAITNNGGPALCKWGGAGAREKLRTMVSPEELNGQLNPVWVAWLMGWPLEWINLEPLAMDRFRQWRHSHGGF